MEFVEYQQMVQNFAFYPHDLGPYYTTMGATSSLGKLADKLRMSLKNNRGSISEGDKQKIMIEIGNILFYLTCTASDLKLNMDEIAKYNIRLLSLMKTNEILGNEK